VISCGRRNLFGFPNPHVLERWRAIGAEIARTDLDGTIAVLIDDAGAMSVERFASPK
jgi:beta-lactamase superfamily II metal-dependent hydrolase